MATIPAPSPENWRDELEAMLIRLRDETLLQAMALLFILSLALLSLRLANNASQAGVLTLIALLLIGLCGWGTYRRRYLVAAWILVLGLCGLVLLAITWGGINAAVWLLALPVGLAALTISVPAGLLLAGLCTIILILTPQAGLSLSETMRVTTLVGIWGMLGMIWIALRCVSTSVRMAWSSYEQTQALQERLQQDRVQVMQTMEDLEAANKQLGLLNRLAGGLRLEAEEARRTKERFVANVSHELRTPLNMIIGFTEMIVRAPHTYARRLPAALLADLEVIRRNSQQLSELVNDVLDLSQIEARQMALSQEHCSAAEIIQAAVTAVRPLFESKGLKLDVQVAEHLPQVFCDRLRIREVILNLLSNAGRFTDRGGVCVQAEIQAGELLVAVRDTGPGIAPEQIARLFEPFWQADRSAEGRKGGSGLGLSISRSFVELHGGKMWGESELGVGTTVYFTVPIDPPATASTPVQRWLVSNWPDIVRTRRSQAPRPVVRPRLLVLDPSGLLQRLLVRYLRNADVETVAELDAVLAALEIAPAQALLINEATAGDEGLARSWRAKLPEGTPIIACALPSIPETAPAMGITGYLVKPISREVLLATLDRLAGSLPQMKTVLIVDDEPDALQLFWRILESAGRDYRVLAAHDGQEALRMMRQQPPDVVLLDLVMPNVDGFQVLAACQAEPNLREVPIIVTSAHDPLGQPIVSEGLSITQPGGLALHELLACIEAAIAILSPLSQPGGRVSSAPPQA
jgi:signal transduction histidine kinase/DNA-binding response OmpR family regulator